MRYARRADSDACWHFELFANLLAEILEGVAVKGDGVLSDLGDVRLLPGTPATAAPLHSAAFPVRFH